MTHVKNGNWVPICKAAVKTLPVNRPFSEVEALFSLSCDYDNDETISETGMAKRWDWSRKKVRLFFKRIGIEILYQPNKKHSPLGGRVGIQLGDDLGTSKGRVRFIDFNNLGNEGDDLGTSKGRVRDELGATTIDPDPKRKRNSTKKKIYDANFLIFWSAYPRKESKEPAEKAWKKLNPDEELREIILTKIEQTKKSQGWQKDNGQFIPYPASWLNARRWEDEVENSNSPKSIKEIMKADDGFQLLT